MRNPKSTVLNLNMLEESLGIGGLQGSGRDCYSLGAFFLSSLISHSAMERRATEPDWWLAARGVGTNHRRVLTPRHTCGCRGVRVNKTTEDTQTASPVVPAQQPFLPDSWRPVVRGRADPLPWPVRTCPAGETEWLCPGKC